MANGRVRYIKGLSTSTFDLGKKETAESHYCNDFRLFLLFFNGNVPRFSLLSHEMEHLSSGIFLDNERVKKSL